MSTVDQDLLQEIVRRITAAVSPKRVVLFGSAARSAMNRDSDVDLLVVMPDGTHRRATTRRVIEALRGIGVAKDIVVVTERDITEHGDNHSLVIKPALEEGRDIYVAA